MMDFTPEIAALSDELVALRRDFHRHPELGFQEFRTSKIVEDYLTELGLEVRRCAGTGVIGVLRGAKPGKTLLLRCDIDALPMNEESGVDFPSENPGLFHGCGHDGHTAVQLVTAKIMAQHRDKLHGTAVFLFQPNEEDAGAEIMIQDGAMDDKPDAVCGFHLWSPIPTGKIGLAPGPLEASSWYFKLTIHGKGGHGGAPHNAINPIDAAAHVLEAIK
ncbi:MAG: amidohydrolase, partial [Oscillospiraceae bacterium]|nr:amidohydrolase [Oscillospiraceae bacterium]